MHDIRRSQVWFHASLAPGHSMMFVISPGDLLTAQLTSRTVRSATMWRNLIDVLFICDRPRRFRWEIFPDEVGVCVATKQIDVLDLEDTGLARVQRVHVGEYVVLAMFRGHIGWMDCFSVKKSQ